MQDWIVNAGGARRIVTVEEDAESGRAAIRVDGKMAARPLMPGEREREVAVGSTLVVIRRNGPGDYDLEQVGELPRTTMSQPKPASASSGPLGWIFLVLVILVVGAFGLREAARFLTYKTISWKTYNSPDHRFVAKFPKEPERKEETIPFGPQQVQSVTLSADRGDHAYLVSYFDVPMLIKVEDAPRWLDVMLKGMTEESKLKIVSRQSTTIAGRPAVRFTGTIFVEEKNIGDAIDEGAVIADYNRIYLIQALRTKTSRYSSDLETFLGSFEIPQ